MSAGVWRLRITHWHERLNLSRRFSRLADSGEFDEFDKVNMSYA